MSLRIISLSVYPRHCSFGRFTMVKTGKLGPVPHSVLLMRHLRICWLYMAFTGIGLLLSGWPRIYTATPVIANMVYCGIINNRSVNISIMYNGTVNIYYSRIIAKTITAPAAAVITVAAVTIPIVYTSIKTYVRPPITCVKTVIAIIKTPIWRSPVQTRVWRCYPNSGYPIIAIIIIIGPVTWLP